MATFDTLAVFDALGSRPTSAATPQLDLRNGHAVLCFDDSIEEQTNFSGFLLANYSGGDLLVRLIWASSTATSGAVRWQAALERHPIGDATHGTLNLNTDDFGAAVEVNSTAGSAAGDLVEAEITLPSSDASDPAAGEGFRLRIARAAGDAADTVAGDAELLFIEIQEA